VKSIQILGFFAQVAAPFDVLKNLSFERQRRDSLKIKSTSTMVTGHHLPVPAPGRSLFLKLDARTIGKKSRLRDVSVVLFPRTRQAKYNPALLYTIILKF
jgi:hypothetical protein